MQKYTPILLLLFLKADSLIFFKKKINKNKQHNPVSKPEPQIATEWLNYEEPETEGQLAIDVYQTDDQIVVKSTIAGVKPENLKISRLKRPSI